MKKHTLPRKAWQRVVIEDSSEQKPFARPNTSLIQHSEKDNSNTQINTSDKDLESLAPWILNQKNATEESSVGGGAMPAANGAPSPQQIEQIIEELKRNISEDL